MTSGGLPVVAAAASRARWLAGAALAVLAYVGSAEAGKRPAEGSAARPAEDLSARLVSMASPAELLVTIAGRPMTISVLGIREDPVCQPERHLAWARSVMPAGSALRLGPADRWGARTVTLFWQGRTLDWAFVLLRAGQVFPGGRPDDSARLPSAYTWAAREARAEGRGLWGECGQALQRFRRRSALDGIPARILYAIAMTESGLAGAPWPWTLNVAGQAQRYATRRLAWQALVRQAASGQRRIDIGLMQINLAYQGFRFRSLWEALDPETNTAVASAILREHWQRSGSLAVAIARYHSADPSLGAAYLQRVLRYASAADGFARAVSWQRPSPSGLAAAPAGAHPLAQPFGRENPGGRT